MIHADTERVQPANIRHPLPREGGRGEGCLLLASIRNRHEARLAAALGADIIDLKEPRRGALGAVARDEQRAILTALGAHRPTVSATVGDLPLEATSLAAAIRATAAAGVDIVKFGVFARGAEAAAGLRALGRALRGDAIALVAVLPADKLGGIGEILELARRAIGDCDVVGVMLDTAAKSRGSLPELLAHQELARFVAAAHAAGRLAGLAGSLRAEHIEPLAATGADLLGFRGALCAGDRSAALDTAAFRAVRERLLAVRSTSLVPA
ncbi:MAG: (5-formylfuran-3-yl)methyl phosphate synthase [Burkholderiales bacterium]|nr:(5-formylfuran-3-yl)methyl phosphate synthase [Burkholderiales bacterium]